VYNKAIVVNGAAAFTLGSRFRWRKAMAVLD